MPTTTFDATIMAWAAVASALLAAGIKVAEIGKLIAAGIKAVHLHLTEDERKAILVGVQKALAEDIKVLEGDFV